MTVAPFSKPTAPSAKAVEDFKRVCDHVGVEGLRDDEPSEAVKALIAEFEADYPPPKHPPASEI